MRLITLCLATLLTLGSSVVFAQQTPETGGMVSPPAGPSAAGGPSLPSKPTGLDKLAADGSTITVRAVPCRKAAWETDGTTTCVGIPEGGRR